MTHLIEKTLLIKADASTVWKTLTEPLLIKQWMGEPEMDIEIHTEWKVNSAIVITGFHHIKFENKGTVLQFEPYKVLKYTQLSSISRLPDKPENHSIIQFTLTPMENQTLLSLIISNFPTETIYKHLYFYWSTTIEMIKDLIEKQ